MSYARKGLDGSHVYVFPTGRSIICHECSLEPDAASVECRTPDEMLGHLAHHLAIGETVPRAAIERLVRESGFAFSLGALALTPGVRASGIPPSILAGIIRRYMGGDFGELDAEDVAANRSAIVYGTRILGAYTHDGVKLFVITEADRSRTTVLLRNEY